MRGDDKCSRASAEKWRARECGPAGRPDVEALIQVAGSQLLRDGCETRQRGAGNDKPKCSEKGRQHERGSDNAFAAAAHKKNRGAHECNHSGQKTFTRCGEQNGNEAEREKAQRRGARQPTLFAVDEEGGQRKAKIEEASDFVGILAVGRETNLTRGDSFRRAKRREGEQRQ